MFAPQVGPVPANGTYNYNPFIDLNAISNPDRVESMDGKIGSKIIDYGNRLTPLQKKKYLAITAVALSALAASAFLALAVVSGGTAFGIGALGCFVATGCGIGYLATMPYDYQQEKVRSKIQHEAKTSDLKTFLSKHSVENIIGFGLLDELPGAYNDPLSYRKFEILAGQFLRCTRQIEQDTSLCNSTYRARTSPLQDWKRSNDIQGMNREIQADVLANTVHYEVQKKRHPGVLDRAGQFGAEVYRGYVHGDVRRQAREVDAVYSNLIAPWDVWRAEELRRIDVAASSPLRALENKYLALKGYPNFAPPAYDPPPAYADAVNDFPYGVVPPPTFVEA